MKRIAYAVLAMAAFGATSQEAFAAIEASSYLSLSDIVITKVSTGMPAVLGTDLTAVIVNTSFSEASLNGLSSTSGPLFPGLDAPISYSDGTTIVAPAGSENNFTRPLSTSGIPYARADTDGSGAAITIGAVTGGATGDTVADVVIPNTASIVNTGYASSAINSTTISFILPSTIDLRLDFDALLDITLDYSLPPSGLVLTGSSSFVATITGVGAGASVTVAGTTDTSYSYSPAALNTGLLTRSTPGVTGGHPGTSSSFSSDVVTLTAGTYTVVLAQGTTASILPVPEPLSLLVWGGLMLLGSAVYSHRPYRNV